MNIKLPLITLLSAYILFLLTTIPAAVVLKNLPENSDITLYGVQGTLWHGKASRLNSDLYTLNNLQWDMVWWRLLAGEISFAVQGYYNQQPVSTHIGLSITGKVIGHDLQARLAAADVAELAMIPIAKLGGSMQLKLDHFSWRNGELPLADGELLWQQASISIAQTVSLGNTTITLQQQDGMLADIHNQGGDLKLQGQATANPSADYKLKLTLVPTRDNNTNLINSLNSFAKKQPDGSFLFESDGKIPL